MPKCKAKTKDGGCCRNTIREEGGLCHFHGEGKEQCTICLYNVCKSGRSLDCGHTFHNRCIEKWKATGKYHCPICRHEFDVPKYKVRILIQNTKDDIQHVFSTVLDRFNTFLDAVGTADMEGLTEIEVDIPDDDDLSSFLLDLGVSLSDFSTTPLRNTE